MRSEWPIISLGDQIILDTGFPFKSAQFVASDSGMKLLRGDNVGQGSLRWDGVKSWQREDADGLSKFELCEGDLVLAMDRPWIVAGLKYAKVKANDLPALLVQRVARLRSKAGLYPGYLHCVVASPEFTQYIQNVTTGTAVPHISSQQIKAFKFKLPPIESQKFSGDLITAIDDQITLLRETNETLEAIAQAIFKSWFVDFDPVKAKAAGLVPGGINEATAALFPDSFDGPIPVGWATSSLDQIAKYLNGLALQKFPPSGVDDLPVIKIAQLRKGDTVGADLANSTMKPEYIVQDGDVLFSWSGSLEVEIWCGGRGALNQHLFKVTSDKFEKWFYFLWTRYHLENFRQIAASKATTMGHIQRAHLSDAKVCVPGRKVLEAANAICMPLIDSMIINSQEIKTLSELRDTLLPRLISGKLKLPETLEAPEIKMAIEMA